MSKLFFAREPQLKRFRGELQASKHYGPNEGAAKKPECTVDRAVKA
jgi:hypothetical protein